MGGILSIPASNSLDDLLNRLESIVIQLETWDKSIISKPTLMQQTNFETYKSEFKAIFKSVVTISPTNSRANDLLTRFKRVELRINVLMQPGIYEYLSEPLISK